ncbi:MAG: hypothetical protein ACRD29_15455 [Acidimicrobiales bacterium]
MILAELEVFHSRPYSPTRRLALGRRHLPTSPSPGFGPLLVAGLVAIAADDLDPDLGPDLERLLYQLDEGDRVVQPRVRHRFQSDRHGLARTWAALIGTGDRLDFDVHGYSTPLQMTLAAAYAAGQLPAEPRHHTFAMIRKGLRWRGDVGPDLLSYLAGDTRPPAWSAAATDPVQWALDVLGFVGVGAADAADADEEHAESGHGDDRPSPRDVQRRYRVAVRRAHPDHGGASDEAAQRIADLGNARRILLG